MFSNPERRRIESKEGIDCSFCGELPDCCIGYDEGNKSYCPRCAYFYGAIDEEQLRDDELDSSLCLEKS